METESQSVVSYFLSPEAVKAGILFCAPRKGDAGFDLPALGSISIPPSDRMLIPTGLHIAIPEGWVGLVRDRSSVALRGGLVTAGVIDSSYRGEIRVLMHNLGSAPLTFNTGERIAQMLILPHHLGSTLVQSHSVEDLGVTDRQQNGFGSTGA